MVSLSPRCATSEDRTRFRTLFGHLYNGESTAIVGEPHIGKSSMLRYMADAGVRAQWLGEVEAK